MLGAWVKAHLELAGYVRLIVVPSKGDIASFLGETKLMPEIGESTDWQNPQ